MTKRQFLLALLLLFGVGASAAEEARPTKYVFLLIGDGMGAAQRQLPELVTGRKLRMNELPVRGVTKTDSAEQSVTDSAAAGTALATGRKTNNGVLGLDPAGKRLDTLAEFAKRQGYKVGIVSSATLNHATPAAFYAHVANRGMYDDISAQLAVSGIDFLGGGGLGANKGSKPAYDRMRDAGWNVTTVRTATELAQVGVEGKTYIHRRFGEVLDDREQGVFTLADMTTKAIAALDGPAGFFLMVEGGQIDWRCHSNCPAGTVAEVLDFDAVVEVAYRFYKQHPEDTLIVVTADHETGGLGIDEPEKTAELRQEHPELLARFLARQASYSSVSRAARTLRDRKASFAEAVVAVRQEIGVEQLTESELQALRKAWERSELSEEERKMLYAKQEPFAVAALRVVGARMGIGWGTFGHSASDIVTTSVGAGAEGFAGSYHLTHIAQVLFRRLDRGK